jgi:hypothetical protein
MLAHRPVMLANSDRLNVPLVKGVSVMPRAPAGGCPWIVVPQASIPPAKAPVSGTDATSLTTADVGMTPVKVVLSKSAFSESDAKPFGVTKQEQHETNCSSGENVYTLTHRFPTDVPNPGPSSGAPLNPVLVTLMTESPLSRFAAKRIRNEFSGGCPSAGKSTAAAAVVQTPVGGGGVSPIVMMQLVVVVPAGVPVLSTTLPVKPNGPAVVGVPVIAPVVGFNVSPGGRLPALIENVYGGTPPAAISDEL